MNVLTYPLSGRIIFDANTAGASTVSPLSSSCQIIFDGSSMLTLVSYVSALNRFAVEGNNGRLFTVTDQLTGTIFSVSDISGLPLMTIYSDVSSNTTKIGTYNQNAFVVYNTNVGIGIATPTQEKLTVAGNVSAQGGYYSSYKTVSSTYTVLSGDSTINCMSAASYTVQLHTATGFTGKEYKIKNSTVTGLITLSAFPGQTIDGQTNWVIAYPNNMYIQSTGFSWIIL